MLWRKILLISVLMIFAGFVLFAYGKGEAKTWKDSKSGLTWQVEPMGEMINWTAAKAHCMNLSLDGHDDWRLPTISELRSLIRGHKPTAAGGACGIKDSCLAEKCWSSKCGSASRLEGPGEKGAYWPPALKGKASMYWSSSLEESEKTDAWGVSFDFAHVGMSKMTYDRHVRCVRK